MTLSETEGETRQRTERPTREREYSSDALSDSDAMHIARLRDTGSRQANELKLALLLVDELRSELAMRRNQSGEIHK